MKYTPEQLKYLSWLNNELAKKEKELYERAKNLFDAYEKRVKADSQWASKRNKENKVGDLEDYILEVVVKYSVGHDSFTGGVRYVHTESIHYSTFEDENKIDEIGFGHVKDVYPEFKTNEDLYGDNMCWFFWKFYDDLPVNLRFKISEIWFEIHICEQNVLEIVKYQYM
jgi:hypothetical protein